MSVKHLLLLVISAGFFDSLYSQNINEGSYNEWDYGPNGVYGNLPLTNVKDRQYFKIEKTGLQSAKILQFNPSGIVVNTASVIFVNGVLSKVEKMNQWGETYEYIKYKQKDKNEFIVTDLVRGVNNYLPCKYARYIYKDELLIETRYFSANGDPAENKNGYAIIRYKRYDDKIRFAEIREMSFYDAQDRPVISKLSDYHKVVYEFDDKDNKISEWYFGINDKPATVRKSNQAGVKYYYNEQNRVTRTEYRSLDNRITANVYGVAIAEFQYIHGYQVQDARFDSLHRATRASASGDSMCLIKYEYDSNGNKTKESFFDEKESPICDHSGIHEIINTYSSSNLMVQTSYFDDFEQPAKNIDSIHTIIYLRDTLGRIIEKSTYHINGKPLRSYTEEVFMLKYRYDEYGRVISDSYWLDRTTKMPAWGGEYELATKFDEDGQPVEYKYLDQQGKPFMTEDGSSEEKLIRNMDGSVSERRFTYNDILIKRFRGVTKDYSIIRYGHDENGRVSELSFFDKDSHPVNATIWIEDSIPAHRIVFVYRGSRIIEQRYYEIGNDNPSQIADCLKNDCIAPSGISIRRKNAY